MTGQNQSPGDQAAQGGRAVRARVVGAGRRMLIGVRTGIAGGLTGTSDRGNRACVFFILSSDLLTLENASLAYWFRLKMTAQIHLVPSWNARRCIGI
jgi:hypothetical protein